MASVQIYIFSTVCVFSLLFSVCSSLSQCGSFSLGCSAGRFINIQSVTSATESLKTSIKTECQGKSQCQVQFSAQNLCASATYECTTREGRISTGTGSGPSVVSGVKLLTVSWTLLFVTFLYRFLMP